MSAKIVSKNRRVDKFGIEELNGMIIVMVAKGGTGHFVELTEEVDDHGDITCLYRPSSQRVWKTMFNCDLVEAVQYWAKREYKVKWTVME